MNQTFREVLEIFKNITWIKTEDFFLPQKKKKKPSF